MAIVQIDYVITASRTEVLARLRQRAAKLRWHIEEESGFSLFCLRTRRLIFRLFTPTTALAVSLHPDRERTIACFTVWGGAEPELRDEPWKLLAGAGLTAKLAPEMTAAALSGALAPAAHSRGGWLTGIDVLRWLGVALACAFGAVGSLFDWRVWSGAAAIGIVALVSNVIPAVAEELAVRHVLRIRSKRGVGAVVFRWGCVALAVIGAAAAGFILLGL